MPFPVLLVMLYFSAFKNEVTKRVFSRGYADAQTKPPGRINSNETSAERFVLQNQTARIAQMHGS